MTTNLFPFIYDKDTKNIRHLENNSEVFEMDYENGSFVKGMFWGVLLSVPLWISVFGWVKLLYG